MVVCDNCIHEEVCMFEKDIRKKISELNINVDDPLTLTFSCKHYYAQQYNQQYNSRLVEYNSSSTSSYDSSLTTKY